MLLFFSTLLSEITFLSTFLLYFFETFGHSEPTSEHFQVRLYLFGLACTAWWPPTDLHAPEFESNKDELPFPRPSSTSSSASPGSPSSRPCPGSLARPRPRPPFLRRAEAIPLPGLSSLCELSIALGPRLVSGAVDGGAPRHPGPLRKRPRALTPNWLPAPPPPEPRALGGAPRLLLPLLPYEHHAPSAGGVVLVGYHAPWWGRGAHTAESTTPPSTSSSPSQAPPRRRYPWGRSWGYTYRVGSSIWPSEPLMLWQWIATAIEGYSGCMATFLRTRLVRTIKAWRVNFIYCPLA